MMRKIIVGVIFVIPLFAQVNGAKYLIITADNFYNQVLPLANWKHKKGVPTKVVKVSEIGNSYSSIKSYIQNAYNTWEVKPEYVLLFGAVEYLATGPSSQGYDHYYSDLTGNAIPEIAVGRLPCQTTVQAQTMVQKVFSFEKTVLLNPDWYIKGLTIVRRDYDSSDTLYFRDARMAHNFWIQYGYTHIDSLRSDWGHNANTVINSVNDGREIVLYRGTAVENWYYPFEVDPYQTSNVKKLPIIISATCQTIAMYPYDEFAGERWLRVGTPTNLKGAVAFMGTTTLITGGAIYRSAFARGFLKRVYRDSVFILGDAFKAGKQQIYDSTGNLSEVRSWQLLGDPEMNIWTKSPDSFLVTYPETIPPTSQTISVIVQSKTTQNPVPHARVCIMDTNDIVYVYGETDFSGQVNLNIPQVNPCTLYITVTKPNYLAFEQNIYVMPINGPYVNYYNHIIFDQNGDGIINPGENVQIAMEVKNYGTNQAYSVNGKSIINDTLINLTDSLAFFGDVPPDSTSWDSTAFYFHVSPACTNGYQIPLDITFYTVSGDTWSHMLYLYVGSPSLIALRDSFSDEIPYGNGNNRWQPGETIKFFIFLENQGYGQAESVEVFLKSGDTLLNVIDSTGFYGDIPPQTVKANQSDPFILKTSVNANYGTQFPCTLIIVSKAETSIVNYSIRMGLPSGTIIYSFQVPPPMQVGGWITGLACDGTGLWVADYNANYLYKLNPDNGSYVTYIPAPGGNHVYDIAYDPNDGNLWVNNMGNDRIYKVNSSNGSIIQLFYSPATNASGLTFDGTYLWITEYSSNIIYRVNPQNGSVLGTYYLPYSGDGSREIALDGFGPDGGSIIHTRVFYTGSFDSSYVYEWNRITHTPTGNKFKLNFNIRGVEWDPNTGDYWVAEPHSSIRGYIHRVIGFNYPPVGVQEKEKVKEKENISINSNIFNGKAQLTLSIPQKTNLKIEVFDALGRKVKTLHKGDLKKGEHIFDFRIKSSGIYFILVRSDKFAKVFKIMEVSHA